MKSRLLCFHAWPSFQYWKLLKSIYFRQTHQLGRQNLQLEHAHYALKHCCILPPFKPKETLNQCAKICFRRTGNLQATIVQTGQEQFRSCCLNHKSSPSLASAFFSPAKRNMCCSMLKSHLIQLLLANSTSWKMHCIHYLLSSLVSQFLLQQYTKTARWKSTKEKGITTRQTKVCNAIMKHKQNQAQQHPFCRGTNPSFMMACC